MAGLSRLTNGKVKAIILTKMLENPNKKYTAKELSEFINEHDFGMWERITPNRIGSILRSANPHSNSMLRIIKHEMDSRSKRVYWIEEENAGEE